MNYNEITYKARDRKVFVCGICGGPKKLPYTEKCKSCAARRPKHGKVGTRVYNTWNAMVARTTKPNSDRYKFYGARGIDIDPRWLHFPTFLADMGEPGPQESLGRIDNSRGYWPDNCRWETQVEQANNTRNNVFLEWRGQKKTIAQWAREVGLPYYTINNRIRRGWSVDSMLSTPNFAFGQRREKDAKG